MKIRILFNYQKKLLALEKVNNRGEFAENIAVKKEDQQKRGGDKDANEIKKPATMLQAFYYYSPMTSKSSSVELPLPKSILAL